jgi:hypothetical protein
MGARVSRFGAWPYFAGTAMKDIRRLDSLFGLRLRIPFWPRAETLGPPDETAVSPPNADTSVFVDYIWSRAVPALGVLTWRTSAGEYICGVRVFGAGGVDRGLGFGVGAPRSAVDARCPGAGALQGDSVRIALRDGSLTVEFADDRVREIQLLAPLGE